MNTRHYTQRFMDITRLVTRINRLRGLTSPNIGQTGKLEVRQHHTKGYDLHKYREDDHALTMDNRLLIGATIKEIDLFLTGALSVL